MNLYITILPQLSQKTQVVLSVIPQSDFIKADMKFPTKEDLTKFAIEYFFLHNNIPEIKKNEVLIDFHRKGACFVSVYVDGELRGCIGDHQAYEPLYLNIIKNAIRAAFSDFRFPPLQKNELPRLKAEVSVLTTPVEFIPKTTDHLLQLLGEGKPGLIIEKEGRRALFLPQVWEKLKTPQEFLSHLCLKATLFPSCWQEKNIKYWIFYIHKN